MGSSDFVNRRLGGSLVIAALALALTASGAFAALTVEVTPNHLRVAYGASADLVLVARDANGSVVTGTVAWEVVPARLGTITTSGHFSATGIGRGLIRATVTAAGETGTGHAMVSVSPLRGAPQTVISLDPASARIDPGGLVQFHIVSSSGAPAAGTAIEWRVVPETLGRVDANGLFVAGAAPGTGHVVARIGAEGLAGSFAEARVVVGRSAPGNVLVRVSPERGILRPGESRRFEVSVTRADGSTVSPSPAVEWSVIPPEIGMVGPDGMLTAGGDVADGRVIATVATADGVSRGYASVAIRQTSARPLAVQIHPIDAVVEPGGELRFEATVLGSNGPLREASIDWSVEPASVGQIGADGIFTAVTPRAVNGGAAVNRVAMTGRIIATAHYQGETATAMARVTIGERQPQLWLRILPQRATLVPGEQLQFSAEVIGRVNGAEAPRAEIRWSVSSDAVGTITPAGLFTASHNLGNTGSPNFGKRDGVVTAIATLPDGRTIRGTAIVLVRQPGVDEGISLQPATMVVEPGHGGIFRVLVGGIDATQLGYTVRWAITSGIGTIGAHGEFYAAQVPVQMTGVVTAHVQMSDGQSVDRTARVRIAARRSEGQLAP